MEGKELLKFLDFVEELRTKRNNFGNDAREAIDQSEKTGLKAKAHAYAEIADELERVLRKLNS